MEEKWFTVKEVAEMLHKSAETIRDWCKDDEFPGAIKDRGGQWSIPQSGIDNRGKEASEIKEESHAVANAEDLAKIAEFELATTKAEREREALFAGRTLAEFNLDSKVLSEGLKDLQQQKEAFVIEQANMATERKAWTDKTRRTEEQNAINSDNNKKLLTEVSRLKKLLDIHEEEVKEEKDNEALYTRNIEQTINLLNKIAEKIKEYDAGLSEDLERKVNQLNSKISPADGLEVVKECHDDIIATAGYFQDTKFKNIDGEKVAEWLFDADEKLEKLMRIKWVAVKDEAEERKKRKTTYTPYEPQYSGFERFLIGIGILKP